jgi:large subunit ribosomal protein L5
MADKKEDKEGRRRRRAAAPKTRRRARLLPPNRHGREGGKQKGGKGQEGKSDSARELLPARPSPRSSSPDYKPRLRSPLRRRRSSPALTKKFSLQEPDDGPPPAEGGRQHGSRRRRQNPKIIDSAVEDLRSITGQKPVVTRARKSIATFKLRENLPIGVMVTLRASACGSSSIASSRFACRASATSRASRAKGFDGKGNFTMGLREQIIFPEIDYDKVDASRG